VIAETDNAIPRDIAIHVIDWHDTAQTDGQTDGRTEDTNPLRPDEEPRRAVHTQLRSVAANTGMQRHA